MNLGAITGFGNDCWISFTQFIGNVSFLLSLLSLITVISFVFVPCTFVKFDAVLLQSLLPPNLLCGIMCRI